MKITIKNKTNMIAYTNIPEYINKVVLKHDRDGNVWLSDKYQIARGIDSLVNNRYEIQISKLGIGGSADIFPPRLNIVNGIKLNQGWEPHPTVDGVYVGFTQDNFLIDALEIRGDLYIYGVFEN